MIGQAWALLDWQTRLVAGLVLVLVALLATLLGGFIEWVRDGGVRDLDGQVRDLRGQLADARIQAHDYWLAYEAARDDAQQAREIADAEHRRGAQAWHRMLVMRDELAQLRAAAVEQGRLAVRATEVVDMALWQAEHAVRADALRPP